MEIRKSPLVNGECYHIITRSIAKFKVFNEEQDYQRMIDILDLYRFKEFYYKYSQFLNLSLSMQGAIINNLRKADDLLVEIIAYCVMPTHIHLVLKQLSDNGISKFMSRILNSYSRYFNTNHKRKGPLWEGVFKNILISKDEYLLHLTRYLHLNAVSAGLVDKPEDWQFSSYHEYINCPRSIDGFCDFKELIDMEPAKYRHFVNNHKSYQRSLAQIKHLLLEDYIG